MLVEMAIADAYGIAWEFTDLQTAPNDLSAFHSHPRYHAITPGMYTDDTQRAIGNCNAISNCLNSDRIEDLYNPVTYATGLLEAYHTDPRDGYSRGFQSLLHSKTIDSGLALFNHVVRSRASNGSVMGVAPLGFLPSQDMVKNAATAQALSTHSHATILDAQIVALSAHSFIYGSSTPMDLVGFLAVYVDWDSLKAQTDNLYAQIDRFMSDPTAATTIEAKSISSYAVYAVTTFTKMSEIIIDAVRRGGDTDSAAATAIALASCTDQIENDIPFHLYDELDNANPGFGIAYLESVEQRMFDNLNKKR